LDILEKSSSRGDSRAKVHTYQLHFSLAKTNSNLCPWQIIERLARRSNPACF
jgi:hypothetical protein